jgi:hypothetical protein
MMNILGQGVQISPIPDNSHKGMDCQPAGVSGHNCLACQSGA